jgi:hypothetical protein
MWIVLGRILYGVRRSRYLEQVQSYRCRKRLAVEFFGRAYISNHTKLEVDLKLAAIDERLSLQFTVLMYAQILENDSF